MNPHASRWTVAALALLGSVSLAHAQAIQAAATGCSAAGDAERIATLQAQGNKGGAEAFAKPLVATRRCLEFPKGIRVDIDERKPPLACVRLTGDLSCYWLAATLVDEHPGEKGGAASGRHGGRHH